MSGAADSIQILEPLAHPERWIPARARRVLLASYLDLILLSIPWAFLEYLVDHFVPGFQNQPWYLRMAIFTVIEVTLIREDKSPGMWLLGMHMLEVRTRNKGIEKIWEGHAPYVDRATLRAESWFTLLCGVLFANSGAKAIVRWTMWVPPPLFFGQVVDGLPGILIYLVAGGIELYIAREIFRLRMTALWAAAGFYVLWFVSAWMSKAHWAAWIADYYARRRAYFGLPPQAKQLEALETAGPWVLLLGVPMVFLLLAFLWKHLSRAERLQREGDAVAVAIP